MKLVLGDTFKVKPSKFKPFLYQIETNKESKRFNRFKLNLSNLLVYIYLKVVYPFCYSFVYPLTYSLNIVLVRLLNNRAVYGLLLVTFNLFFVPYIFFLKRINLILHLESLRSLLYSLMVHLSFRDLGCQFKDLVARIFKLTTQEETTHLDYLVGVIYNSHLNLNMTNEKFDVFGSRKRILVSYFLLYPEKEKSIISNKVFLENLFDKLSIFYIKDKELKAIKIKEYKRNLLDKFLSFLSLVQRFSFLNFLELSFFSIKKIFLLFFLLFVLPLLSFVVRCLVFMAKPFLFFVTLFSTFVKNLVTETFALFHKLAGILGLVFSVAIVFSTRQVASYRELVRALNDYEHLDQTSRIAYLKGLLRPIHRIRRLFPSWSQIKFWTTEYLLHNSVAPSLQAENDTFLFHNRQRIVSSGKVNELFDWELYKHIYSRDEIQYWELAGLGAHIPREQELFVNAYYNDDTVLQEQEETEDEEDFEDDFWIIHNNYEEYDVVYDLNESLGYFNRWLCVKFPIFYPIQAPFNFLVERIAFLDDFYHIWYIFYDYMNTHDIVLGVKFLKYNYIFWNMLFLLVCQGCLWTTILMGDSFLVNRIFVAVFFFTILLVLLSFLLLVATRHIPHDYYTVEHDPVPHFMDELDELMDKDAALVSFFNTLTFVYIYGLALGIHPMVYLQKLGLYRNSSFSDLSEKVDRAFLWYNESFWSYLQYLISYITT